MQDLFNDQFFSDTPLVTYAEALARAARTATGDDLAGVRYFCAGNQPVTIYRSQTSLEWGE